MAGKKAIGLDQLPGFLFRQLHELGTARFEVNFESLPEQMELVVQHECPSKSA